MFTVQIKPVVRNDKNKQFCNIIEPDFVHVTIDDTIEDSKFDDQ